MIKNVATAMLVQFVAGGIMFAQPKMKELPKIDLFPPGGIRAMPRKRIIRPLRKLQIEPLPGHCSVPLTNVEPQRNDGKIKRVPLGKDSRKMPQFGVPAPSCEE